MQLYPDFFMKKPATRFLAAAIIVCLVACDRPAESLEEKLGKLEKAAAVGEARQKQLENQLAEQKRSAEADTLERERAQIEQDRLAMQNANAADTAAALSKLQHREAELFLKEEKISKLQIESEDRKQALTGLEKKLTAKESRLAGRAPLASLRNNRARVSGSPTADFSQFYEPLGDYGSWFQTRNYGYVFQPAVVRDRSWRPYTRGRWAFTDLGWTWASDEPFGWACYHYGRWALLRNAGWVWVPGSEWAPSWVTWRESPSHIGWAPLPPETLAWRGRRWDSNVENTFGISSQSYNFIPYNHFGNNIRPYYVQSTQNTVIFGNTVNITQYQIIENRIFVGGPGYQRVCSEIGRPFPIHRLEFNENPGFDRPGRYRRSEFRGEFLEVDAPRMDAVWNAALSPQRIAGDLGEIEVERTNQLPESLVNTFQESRDAEASAAEEEIARSGSNASFELERRERLEEAVNEEENRIPTLPEVMPELTQEPPTVLEESTPPAGVISPTDAGISSEELALEIPAPVSPTPENTESPGEEINPIPALPEPQVNPDTTPPSDARIQEPTAEPEPAAEEKSPDQSEQIQRQQLEEAQRQQQEEMQLQQQEEMQRQQQVEAQRHQQEEAQREQQKEAQREQQEEMQRQQQEEAQRQQQEMQRQQQEEAQRQQQEEAQRQQQEQAQRQQQEEAQRQQQEEAQRQQQEEAQRQQQEEAQRQQQEQQGGAGE